MGPGRDRTRDPWNCSQTRIGSQTRYRLRYAARSSACSNYFPLLFISYINECSLVNLYMEEIKKKKKKKKKKKPSVHVVLSMQSSGIEVSFKYPVLL